MGTRSVLLAVAAVGCLVLFALPGPAVGGDDDAASTGVWVYDLRIVRVDTPDVATPEAGGAWEPAGDGTTTKAWPELLKLLKERGRTLVVMDQRVTTIPGRDVSATQTKDVQIKQYQSSDFSTERHQSASLSSGCVVKLRPEGNPTLPVKYDVTVKWILPTEGHGGTTRPMLGTSSWSGTHGALDGKTLVLVYREQIEHLDGERQGLEIYAFLTGRFVP